MLENYPTARADLRLRLPSQRYFEEEDEVELSPRNFGILMHKAFEEADDRQQIYEAVQRMRDDGTLSPGEAEPLRGMIARALLRLLIGQLFLVGEPGHVDVEYGIDQGYARREEHEETVTL